MQKTPEQLAWERASAAGNARARTRLLRIIAAFAAAAIAGALTLVVLMQFEESSARDRAERRAHGEIVIRSRAPETGLHLLVIPVGVGLGAFLAVFVLLGGRLSPEHLRGLRGDD